VQEERAGNLCKTFATSKISEVLVSMNSTHADHTYPLKKKNNVQFHSAHETPAPDKCSKSIISQVQKIFSAQQTECVHKRPKWK